MNRAFGLTLRRLPSLLRSGVIQSRPSLIYAPKRFYWPNDELMTRTEGEYFLDPQEVAGVVARMFALHDNVSDPSKVTLGSTFEEIGLNDLDKAEVLLMLELHYHIEIADDS
mmetsp:Transcript_31643/g.28039  ORF Transcript_31643/g.28039 Transcript_31643/m.28039 type:complete len:112 (-) Transcript_31643:119-454(-)